MTPSAQSASAVAVDRYLDVLFGRARPSTLIDVRWRRDGRMAQAFVPVRDRSTLTTVIPALAAQHDVYVGVLPRWRRSGGRSDVVGDCRTVWADLDTDVAARVLEPVDPAPSLVVASALRGICTRIGLCGGRSRRWWSSARTVGWRGRSAPISPALTRRGFCVRRRR